MAHSSARTNVLPHGMFPTQPGQLGGNRELAIPPSVERINDTAPYQADVLRLRHRLQNRLWIQSVRAILCQGKRVSSKRVLTNVRRSLHLGFLSEKEDMYEGMVVEDNGYR